MLASAAVRNRPLIKERKKTARALLYLGPLALVALALAFVRYAGDLGIPLDWMDADFESHESVRIFQEFLRIDTSPDGNEIPGAELLARHLENAGLEAHVERLGERHANIWATLEGDDPQALVLLNHLDVEPTPYAEHWRHPPFSGAIEGPFIFGRGTFDMKSLTIAQLMAVLEIARSGKRPARSLMFLGTSSEEVDSRLGMIWVLRQHPELVERFHAVLTEGGAIEAIDIGQVKYWGTEFMQKRFVDIWICDASAERLEAARADLLARQVSRSRRLLAPVKTFLAEYRESRESAHYRKLIGRVEEIYDTPRIQDLPPFVRSMLRDELYVSPVMEAPGGGYQIHVILHLLPDAHLADSWHELVPPWLDLFSYRLEDPHAPTTSSPLDHEVFLGIDRFMAERLPEIDHGPLFLARTATDARFLRPLGIPTYGFSPFVIITADTHKAANVDERIAATAFIDGVELYVDLVADLVGAGE